MAVSAIDLRCVFGRSLVVFDRTTLVQFVMWTQGVLYIDCSTEEGSSAMS